MVCFLFWILWFKDVQPGLFFIRIFRVLNTVQSFIFKVHFVVAFVLSSNSFILSQSLAFVNNFFIFFKLSWSLLPPFSAASYIISNASTNVNSFFQFFYFMFFKAVQRPKLLLKYLFRIFFYIEIIHPFLQGLREWQSASPSREHCPRKTMNDFYVKGNYFVPSFYLF